MIVTYIYRLGNTNKKTLNNTSLQASSQTALELDGRSSLADTQSEHIKSGKHHHQKYAGWSSSSFVGVLKSRTLLDVVSSPPGAFWLNMDAIGVELLYTCKKSCSMLDVGVHMNV